MKFALNRFVATVLIAEGTPTVVTGHKRSFVSTTLDVEVMSTNSGGGPTPKNTSHPENLVLCSVFSVFFVFLWKN